MAFTDRDCCATHPPINVKDLGRECPCLLGQARPTGSRDRCEASRRVVGRLERGAHRRAEPLLRRGPTNARARTSAWRAVVSGIPMGMSMTIADACQVLRATCSAWATSGETHAPRKALLSPSAIAIQPALHPSSPTPIMRRAWQRELTVAMGSWSAAPAIASIAVEMGLIVLGPSGSARARDAVSALGSGLKARVSQRCAAAALRVEAAWRAVSRRS